MRAILFVLLILSFTFWLWGLRRAATLFSIVIRDGRITKARGRIPGRLYDDIEDIIRRAGINQGKLRGVVRDGRPVLQFNGEMSPGVQQQMRNVMGQFNAQEIRSGKKR